MSLLTDLKALVTAFVNDQEDVTSDPVDVLLASIDFQQVMTDAATEGKLFVRFPLQMDLIRQYLTTSNPLKELREIELNLLTRLDALYPGIKFYRDKYQQLGIYAQWQEYTKTTDGPVI